MTTNFYPKSQLGFLTSSKLAMRLLKVLHATELLGLAGDFLAGDFLAGDFMAGDFMARDFLAGDFLTS